MEKRIYTQKFEANKFSISIFMLICLIICIFLLMLGFYCVFSLYLILAIAVICIIALYLLLYVLLSIKNNKLIIHDNHIEVVVFKVFHVKKYNLKIEDVQEVNIEHNVGWKIYINLKNNEIIRFSSLYLPLGKGSYYEAKKLLNALKKVNL